MEPLRGERPDAGQRLALIDAAPLSTCGSWGRVSVFARVVGFRVLLLLWVSSCGTDVPVLLYEDSMFYWEADEFISSIEDMNLGLEAAFDRAELEKAKACKKLYKAVEKRVVRELQEGPLPFGEKFMYDLKLLTARLVPLGSVERCRAAIRRYRLEYDKLRKAFPLQDDARAW